MSRPDIYVIIRGDDPDRLRSSAIVNDRNFHYLKGVLRGSTFDFGNYVIIPLDFICNEASKVMDALLRPYGKCRIACPYLPESISVTTNEIRYCEQDLTRTFLRLYATQLSSSNHGFQFKPWSLAYDNSGPTAWLPSSITDHTSLLSHTLATKEQLDKIERLKSFIPETPEDREKESMKLSTELFKNKTIKLKQDD